jgi:hypothetical protein
LNNKLSKPRIYETLLFLAVMSGPPRLRARDEFASLSGQVDWSVLLNAAVWGLAGAWVFFHLGGYLLIRRSIPRFGPLHILAFLLVFCLYLSTFVSPALLLTFYRVSQIPIGILFGFFWLRRFGIDSTLKHLLAGYLLLSVAIGVSAIVAPELVYSNESRLRGDSIANTGAVAMMGIIILLSYPVIKSRALYVLILSPLIALLIMSQTRAAYAVMLVFILLALCRLPNSKPLRSFLYFSSLLVPVGAMLQWAPTVLDWITRAQEQYSSQSIATFSDRLPLWEFTESIVMERSPWIGIGFYANRAITTEYNSDLGTSHSAYLEVFSGGGIVGVSIFSLMLLIELFLITKLFLLQGRNPVVFTTVALFFCTILIGITSEEMVVASPVSFTFWTLLSLIPILHTRTRRREVGIYRESSYGPRALSATRR